MVNNSDMLLSLFILSIKTHLTVKELKPSYSPPATSWLGGQFKGLFYSGTRYRGRGRASQGNGRNDRPSLMWTQGAGEAGMVKLPCTLEGFQAAALLRESAVRVTMTAMYTSSQVLLAQSVGAEYAAPYLGRMNDAYGNNQGYKEVVQMQRILTSQKARTRLLVASIRDAFTMASLAAEGCDTFTISPSVASKLFKVTYTLDAVDQFEAAARRMGAYDLEDGTTTPTVHLHSLPHPAAAAAGQ
ncbi:hypothetical protein Vretimale_16163 [Volvox reticuliferus]|uniref:Uncharacterized protein n=1 Tax=Volvox reticuliferus TaxID=1737510 RepID=A0A8J4CSV1_9CHLO|nr:hypothetical protein Vretifemale_16983 [Volvox reticuliferus]GIM12916.1 hypothetical protein Vretimale_16163 [Volvox reticuliferus]